MSVKGKTHGRLRLFFMWPLILSIFLLIVNICVCLVNMKAGAVMGAGVAVYVLAGMIVFLYRKPRLTRDLLSFAMDYAQIQKQLLTELSVPYGILDKNGRILWVNRELSSIGAKEKNKNIFTVFPELKKKQMPEGDEKVVLHVAKDEDSDAARYYRIELKNVPVPDHFESEEIMEIGDVGSGLVAFYVFDETESVGYSRELEDQKLVAGLIYLDNYDEALESIEEVRRSLLIALIDRKITKYISNMGGIVKKIEKDKYFVAVKQKYVAQMQNDRFYLLEDVKTVNIGNDMAVTLSIGLGMNADTYDGNYEYARTAIDMALGRGGDQAVVKDGENISYFGGRSQQMEKNTRVKARVKAHALRELVMNKDCVYIMGHQIGDIDSLGAAIGIYRAVSFLDKSAHIVVNSFTSSVRPMMERFMNNPDYPADFFVSGDDALQRIGENDVLVIVDVNRPSFTECPQLLEKAGTIVVLDHHRQTREVVEDAVLSYIEPYASSTCEMVAEILQYMGDGIRIKSVEADAIYAGIIIDTNNFLNKTGVRTFEAAAYLRRNGADIVRVRKMFRDKMEEFKARAEAVRDAEVFENSFAIGVCPADGLESPTVTGAQAANELLNIVGIKATFVLTEYNNCIYISARSIDEVNVQLIMERLGGGGHMNVAGAQMTGCSVEEAREYVKVTIKQMLEEGAI